jgi:hypothetical protein
VGGCAQLKEALRLTVSHNSPQKLKSNKNQNTKEAKNCYCSAAARR